MIYADTSLIVAALTDEPMKEAAQDWLGANASDGLLISEWTLTEISSALSMKRRMGTITEIERTVALAEIKEMATDSFTLLGITSTDFQTAARLADRHTTGLRGADALHLAIASAAGCPLWTLDRGQARAGRELGIATHLLA